MLGWSLLLIATVLFVFAAYYYNQLVVDHQRSKSGWSDIQVQLKRRHDLIPKLVSSVRQYAAYEQATLDAVTSLRAAAQSAGSISEKSGLETRLSQGLLSIYALKEAYPELKANQSFLQLQNDISAVELDIQYARRYYNGAVRNLNTRVESFPDLLVARLFKFRAAQYFQFEEDQAL